MSAADEGNARASNLVGWAEVIKTIPAPMRFFALVVLVLYALMVALVARSNSASERMGAMALLALLFIVTMFVVARSSWRAEAVAPMSARFVRDDFETASSRFEGVLNQFSRSDSSITANVLGEGDGERLLDGLFAGLLEVARLALGQDARTSANLTEIAADLKTIRVRAFSGLYSAAVILRAFDVAGLKQGVCSEAYRTGQHQIRPDMTGELLEKGERIRAMVSIPVTLAEGAMASPGDLATLNIETTEKGIVPPAIDDSLRAKLDRLGVMAAKLNNIRRQVAEHTANVRCSRKPTPPVTKDSFPPEPNTALTDTQKKLHGAVLAAPEGIQLGQIEQQLPEFGRSELYYRLECLVLMGYLAKTQNNENTIGIPRVTYRVKAAARVA